jgi:hypothetical protein
MKAICHLVASAGLTALMLATPTAAAAQLQDGTIVNVRLVSPITSEDAKPGDAIALVVTKDVVVNGAVLIARKTPAVGSVVVARRASWGFTWHRAALALAFTQTTAVDGQAIRLRATNAYGQVNIDRSDYHHDLQWATEGDVFQASVAGDYVFRLR